MLEKKHINKNHHSAFSLIELSIVLIIIGLLVAGVTAGQRLIVSARLTTAKAVTESSPVSSIKGLTLWMDAVSDTAFDNSEDIEETDPIARWKDINSQSSKTNFAAAGLLQPSYSENTINSLPAITFNPDDPDDTVIDEKLESVTSFSDLSSTSFTFFVVASFDKVASGSKSVLLHQDGGASILYKDSGNAIASDLHSSPMTSSTTTFSPGIYAIRYSNGGNLQMYTDGNLEKTTAAVEITPSSEKWIIGSDSTPANYFRGTVGEIIFFDRKLRLSEINAVNDYLSQKWQIKVVESTN